MLLAIAVPLKAADNMKAFPPADAGMVRYVLQLPAETDETVLKVELLVGKTVLVDSVNSYFFAGKSNPAREGGRVSRRACAGKTPPLTAPPARPERAARPRTARAEALRK